MDHQRIPPLEPPYEPAVQSAFDAIMPPGMPPLKLFRTVGRNPRVLQRMIAGGLLDRGSITLRQRELLILRSTALCRAEYEWGVHIALFNAKAGFTPEQLADTCRERPNPKWWSGDELTLIALADGLHRHAAIDAALWERLREQLRDEQIIESIMLCGLYHAVSCLVNGLQIELEESMPRFPHV